MLTPAASAWPPAWPPPWPPAGGRTTGGTEGGGGVGSERSRLRGRRFPVTSLAAISLLALRLLLTVIKRIIKSLETLTSVASSVEL